MNRAVPDRDRARAAVFLDRDGTINVEKHYLHRYDDWEWIPGAVDAIRTLNAAGFRVIVVSNQAGIARGLYADADVDALHRRVVSDLRRGAARIDAFYHCPHHPDFGDHVRCDCRKPRPGMLTRAAREHGLDLSRSFLVGDRETDVDAATACGVTPILVATGYGQRSRALVDPAVPYVPSIVEATRRILESTPNTSHRT